jgi:hypothetical protein
MKELKIPAKLQESFKIFLDVAQYNMPDSNDPSLSDGEQKVLKLVRKYLGKELSTLADDSSL